MVPALVSIPLWFSLNERTVRTIEPQQICFHPTMVLAQQYRMYLLFYHFRQFPSHYGSRSTQSKLSEQQRHRSVSIPLWFSLNFRVRGHWSMVRMFPSHYGSRSTGGQRQSIKGYSKVSIPLWFSLNTGKSFSRKYSNTVSIPLWFSLNLIPHQHLPH